jgi:hypothetical protein
MYHDPNYINFAQVGQSASGKTALDIGFSFCLDCLISYQERQRDWPYEARQPIFTVPIPEDERGIDVIIKSLPPGGFFFRSGRSETAVFVKAGTAWHGTAAGLLKENA